LIAFKNFAAGNNGASSIKGNATAASTRNGTVHGMAANDRGDAGNYAWFLTPDAPKIGIQTLAPNAASFDRYQQCLEACDIDRTCAAVRITQNLDTNTADNPKGNTGYNNEGPKSCMLVRGNTSPGTNKRSVVRTITSNVIIPTWTKGARAHVCCGMPCLKPSCESCMYSTAGWGGQTVSP
jgi:hypothetical protein